MLISPERRTFLVNKHKIIHFQDSFPVDIVNIMLINSDNSILL